MRGRQSNAIVGKWKWSGILTYQGGLPRTFRRVNHQYRGGLEDQGWGNANQVPGQPLRSPTANGHFDPHKDELINEAAFVVPPEWTFGSFSPITGPAGNNTPVSPLSAFWAR